jgi:hypothetical protein
MHLVHNVGVHNDGINVMENDPMPPFAIPRLQSVMFTKSRS